MLIEEEIKEVNPDAIEEGFEEEILVEEDTVIIGRNLEDDDDIDIAFTDDDNHW